MCIIFCFNIINSLFLSHNDIFLFHFTYIKLRNFVRKYILKYILYTNPSIVNTRRMFYVTSNIQQNISLSKNRVKGKIIQTKSRIVFFYALQNAL